MKTIKNKNKKIQYEYFTNSTVSYLYGSVPVLSGSVPLCAMLVTVHYIYTYTIRT